MNLRARLVGLTATLLIIALLIGLPMVLLQVGADLIPDTVPTLERLRTALTSPDDGTLAMTVITLIGWVAWAVLAASLLLEIAAQVRNIHPPRLPGLSLPQGAARELVAAAALLFIAVPTTAAPTAAAASGHASLTVPAATAGSQTPALGPATATSPSSSPHRSDRAGSYTIAPGDTLSRIAREHFGDADLWPRIVEANPHLAADPDLIHPGDVIELPAAPEPRTVPRQYSVRAGDTLSGIAHRFLGDGDRWHEIFAASTSTIQPGGVRITDPDQIDIGQIVTIPAATTHPNSPAAGSVAAEPSPSASHTTSSDPGHDRATAAPTGVPADVPTSAPQAQQGGAGSPAAPSVSPSTSPSSPSPTSTQLSRGASAQTDPPGSNGPDLAPPVPAGARQDRTASADADSSVAETPWLIAGLSGGGALLAGAMMLLLRQRRRAQLRTRRPGHTLTTPAPPLHPVEKTLTAIGTVTAPTIERLDGLLRRLAAGLAATGSAMPDLAAVELTAAEVILHLRTPAEMPEPWNGTDDHLHWGINAHTPLDDIGPEIPDQPAPYPLLVTIGVGDADQMWLLNLEDLTVTITGDPTCGQDFARYLAADLACTPWASGVTVTCSGIATELTALNPDRIRAHDPTTSTSGPAGEHLAEAVATIDRADDADLPVATARAHQHGADSWPAHVLLLDATAQYPDLDQLLDLIATHPGATASAVVLCDHAGDDTNASSSTARDTTAATVLEITADGRLQMPQTGLDLVAVGLTPDEAHGCAALIAQAETATNTPVPVDTSADDGWHSLVDEAGALRREHTQPRHPDHTGHSDTDEDGQDSDTATDAAGAVSLLEDDDQTYLQTAATTEQDLATLAPRVTAAARATVEDTDPSLDHDVAMWFHPDCALPRLHLLGPVRATTRGEPMIDRKPYMTALLTFIALTPHGATPEEVAQTFNITTGKAREYVRKVRNWLGKNPRTHALHLPYAKDAPGTQIRTTPVYQVIDLLIDMDIFRRLRARGQARGGPDGIADLTTALQLVQGRPFDYPIQNDNERNWTWLIDGDRIDQHIAVAIVDVAHIVTTHALAAGDLATARTAAETALTAAPDEDTPRLDLAAVAQTEGNHAEAQHIIRDDICNRTDDDGPPPELPHRTQHVLQQRKQRLHKAS